MITPFTTYFRESIQGILTNELFIGIVLAMIVQDVRNSKYISFEHHIKKEGFEWDALRALFYLFSYVVAVPVGLIALMGLISILWVISFITG